jgi:hypothetical protein
MNFKISFATGLGSSLAAVVSYNHWHSIGWAMFHGFLGWFYVLYAALGN